MANTKKQINVKTFEMTDIVIEGELHWPFLHKPDDYGKNSVIVAQLSEEDKEKLEGYGFKVDESEDYGYFYRARRNPVNQDGTEKEPLKVLNSDQTASDRDWETITEFLP